MVTLGDFHGSPNRNLRAVKDMLSQKLFVVNTEATKRGKAIMFPPTQIHALSMGLPLPNLSAMIPPAIAEVNPQNRLIME